MPLILLNTFESINHTEYTADRQINCVIRSEDIISMRETYDTYACVDIRLHETIRRPLTYIRIKSTENATGVYSTYVSDYVGDILNIIKAEERR